MVGLVGVLSLEMKKKVRWSEGYAQLTLSLNKIKIGKRGPTCIYRITSFYNINNNNNNLIPFLLSRNYFIKIIFIWDIILLIFNI